MHFKTKPTVEEVQQQKHCLYFLICGLSFFPLATNLCSGSDYEINRCYI